jgi:hypothetical protein
MPHLAAGGSVERRPRSRPVSGQVRVEGDGAGATVTISVSGCLDAVAGNALLDTVRAELDRGPSRIDVDLVQLVSFTEQGAAALAALRVLGTGLVDGLHYRTEAGAGGDAVLAAFAQEVPIPD